MSEPGGERQPGSFDEWLGEFFRDSSLTPIVIVVAGSLATVGASVIAWAVRGGGFPPVAALVVLGGMSLDAIVRDRRRNGRFGLLSRCLLGLWTLSALAAAGAMALGLA